MRHPNPPLHALLKCIVWPNAGNSNNNLTTFELCDYSGLLFIFQKSKGWFVLTLEEGLPAKASDYTRALPIVPHHHADWQAETHRNTSSVTHHQVLGALSGERPASWQTGREELGGFLFLAQMGGKYQIFFCLEESLSLQGILSNS